MTLKIKVKGVNEYQLGGEYDENRIWKPNKDGLGVRHAFDELNKIYGKGVY